MLHVAPNFQPVFRELGIDADAVFADERIKPWRTLPDRQNCTLDECLRDGREIRWHVKRYPRARIANEEVHGFELLHAAQIPTATLVGWGSTNDGRAFVIWEDLAGYEAADKLIGRGEVTFENLIAPTADLASRLHSAGLHHRDLYLCHFFASSSGDVRLIDTVRVKRLPAVFARRWIVKDLAQFWYSTQAHQMISDAQRRRWLNAYCETRRVAPESLSGPLRRKASWIARHDQRLRQAQPKRNISIPR
jgi:hypothetical protein